MWSYGRCILEGLSIVAISNVVEPMFTDSYKKQTQDDMHCRLMKHAKFKTVENYMMGLSNKGTNQFDRRRSSISELDMETFVANILGEEVLLDIIQNYKEIPSAKMSSTTLQGDGLKISASHKESHLEHVVSLLALSSIGDLARGNSSRIDWSLVSPGQYSLDLAKKVALQMGLTAVSIMGFNKAFGYVSTWSPRLGVQPHFFRRCFKLGLVGILSYVFMTATIEALYEAAEEFSQEEFERSELGREVATKSNRSVEGPQAPFRSLFGSISELETAAHESVDSNKLYPYSLDESDRANRAGATPEDPFHANRLANVVMALPAAHEGFLYTMCAFKRFAQISGSPTFSCLLTALCYALSKWKEGDVQSALLGFIPEDLDDTGPVTDYGDMDRTIYNFSRSLMLSLGYIASKNVLVPVAMYAGTNVHMLFDEFLLRNDFIKENSFVWGKMVQLTAVTSIVYGKFHDVLIQLRKGGVLHSHVNVINSGNAVPAIQQLCKEGMEVFGALEDINTASTANSKTEQDILRRQWDSFIDFGIAYSMATWYFNQGQTSGGQDKISAKSIGRFSDNRVPPGGRGSNRKSVADHGFSAPIWQKLEENRKRFRAKEAALEKEESTSGFSGGDIFGAFEALARELARSGPLAGGVGLGPDHMDASDNMFHPLDQSINSYLELFSYEIVVQITRMLFPLSRANAAASSGGGARPLFIKQSDYENTVVEHLSGMDDSVLDQVSYAALRRAMFYWELYATEDDVLNLVEAVNTHVMRQMEVVAAQHGEDRNRTGFPTSVCKNETAGIEAQTCTSRYYKELTNWEESCRRKETITALRPYGLTVHRYAKVLATFGAAHPEVRQLADEWEAYLLSSDFQERLKQIARSQ